MPSQNVRGDPGPVKGRAPASDQVPVKRGPVRSVCDSLQRFANLMPGRPADPPEDTRRPVGRRTPAEAGTVERCSPKGHALGPTDSAAPPVSSIRWMGLAKR